VLQQEEYPAIWPLLTLLFRLSLGYCPQSGRRPVRHVAEPPCKISHPSIKLWLRNLLPYKKERHNTLSIPPVLWYGGVIRHASYDIVREKLDNVVPLMRSNFSSILLVHVDQFCGSVQFWFSSFQHVLCCGQWTMNDDCHMGTANITYANIL